MNLIYLLIVVLVVLFLIFLKKRLERNKNRVPFESDPAAADLIARIKRYIAANLNKGKK